MPGGSSECCCSDNKKVCGEVVVSVLMLGFERVTMILSRYYLKQTYSRLDSQVLVGGLKLSSAGLLPERVGKVVRG